MKLNFVSMFVSIMSRRHNTRVLPDEILAPLATVCGSFCIAAISHKPSAVPFDMWILTSWQIKHYSSSFYCFKHKVHLCNNHVFICDVLCLAARWTDCVLHPQSPRNSQWRENTSQLSFIHKQLKWPFLKKIFFSFAVSLPSLASHRPTSLFHPCPADG